MSKSILICQNFRTKARVLRAHAKSQQSSNANQKPLYNNVKTQHFLRGSNSFSLYFEITNTERSVKFQRLLSELLLRQPNLTLTTLRNKHVFCSHSYSENVVQPCDPSAYLLNIVL